MSKWAKEAFERLKTHEGQHHDENQNRALERQQILANAPVIWERVVNQLKNEVSDFDTMRLSYLTIDDQTHDSNPHITVSTPHRHLRLNFQQAVPRITYRVWESQPLRPSGIEIAKGELTFEVKGQEVLLYQVTTGRAVASPHIIENLLGYLL